MQLQTNNKKLDVTFSYRYWKNLTDRRKITKKHSFKLGDVQHRLNTTGKTTGLCIKDAQRLGF